MLGEEGGYRAQIFGDRRGDTLRERWFGRVLYARHPTQYSVQVVIVQRIHILHRDFFDQQLLERPAR